MQRLKFLVSTALVCGAAVLSSVASAQTTLPIGTGYNYATNTTYAVPPTGTSNKQDNYWIKIASYEPPATSVSVAPAWIQNNNPSWAAPGPNSTWVGPQNVNTSPTGNTTSNRGYSIYRKCFCLLPGYKDARIQYNIRGDDNIQVYMNTILNTQLNPVTGMWSWGPGYTISRQDGFKQGKNCIFVLVEDVGGRTGFNLSGNVSAFGLLPFAASGTAQSFEPCQCRETGNPGVAAQATAALPAQIRARGITAQSMDEAKAINDIIALAERRRRDPAIKIEAAPSRD